jgi:hypothetical protein
MENKRTFSRTWAWITLTRAGDEIDVRVEYKDGGDIAQGTIDPKTVDEDPIVLVSTSFSDDSFRLSESEIEWCKRTL